MKHLIVHQFCIDLDLDIDLKQPYLNHLNKKERKKLIVAKKKIDNVIEEGKMNQKDVTDYRIGEPTKVDELFETGDRVMLYGAYMGKCLKQAHQVLEKKGVHVKYHRTGCVKCY